MKLIPAIRKNKRKTVDYADLDERDCFMYDGNLYMKFNPDCDISGYDEAQFAISLNEPDDHFSGFCGRQVIPVDVEIKWAYKKQPAKKAKK